MKYIKCGCYIIPISDALLSNGNNKIKQDEGNFLYMRFFCLEQFFINDQIYHKKKITFSSGTNHKLK